MGKKRRTPGTPQLDLDGLRKAAESARWAMLANMGVSFAIAILWPAVETFADAEQEQRISGMASTIQLVLFLVGAVTFVPWLRGAISCGVALADSEELRRHRDRGVFWSFAVPFMNLVWPYRMLRALDVAIDPAALPEASDSANEAPSTALDRASERRIYAKHPPVRPWWGCWLFARLLAFTSTGRRVDPGVELVIAAAWALSALAAAQIVSRLTARIVEVARRRAALARVAAVSGP
ncbi:MAG: DUF4328 domain-containing protein [Polyangiaceae bacterium]|nr:DUF4328 domain-containing protein [Polyangiaceae bacterium]